MRCKNCGTENEDGRYICQNCGSPLYDENDEILEDGAYPEEYEDDDEEYEKKATKKSIIIIIALAVVLVAVIAGVVFAVTSLGGGKAPESGSSDKVSVTDDYSEPLSSLNNTTEKTTEKTTESTTEKTTESTTKATTTTTTKPSSTKPTEARFKVYVDVDGNGNILGEGEYAKGKRVTLVATPDAGAQFVGWYENGVIVASGTKYSFTVDGDRHLTALFQKAPEEVTDNEPAENE